MLLLRLLYMRHRLMLPRLWLQLQKFIGVKLLRCSARLAECGVWFLREDKS
jgi:hypothetical protein